MDKSAVAIIQIHDALAPNRCRNIQIAIAVHVAQNDLEGVVVVHAKAAHVGGWRSAIHWPIMEIARAIIQKNHIGLHRIANRKRLLVARHNIQIVVAIHIANGGCLGAIRTGAKTAHPKRWIGAIRQAGTIGAKRATTTIQI